MGLLETKKQIPPSAFFSYSRHDAEFVLKLAKDLRAAGASVWLDQIDIDPGERWDSAIEEALANSPNMLVILSPSSVESTNVMDEVSFALEEKKRVIPVLHKECKVPFRLRRLQYIDARVEYEKGVSELLRMLKGREQPEATGASPPSAASGPEPRTSGDEFESLPVEQADHDIRASAEADRQAKERSKAEDRERERAEMERMAREQAEVDRLAKEKAYQEESARQQAEAERQATRRAGEERRDRRADEGRPADVASGASRYKYVIAASLALIGVLVVGGIRSGSQKAASHVSQTTTNQTYESTPSAQGKGGQAAADMPPLEHAVMANPTEWVKQFLNTFEGPAVEPLRPYFDDIVAPYYGMPTAQWGAIEKDKQYYFDRFPTIHYVLLSQAVDAQSSPLGEGELLEFDVRYSGLRKDGQALNGTAHMTLNMRHVNGQWKIAGIRERKIR